MSDIFGRSHISRNLKGNTVLSVEVDQLNSNNVVVTGVNDIKVYDPDSRRVINSWTCKTWCTPSSSCVNSKDGQFYCHMDSKILSWSNQETELENVKPIKIFCQIFKLIPCDGEVLVVYKTGYVESISSALANRKKVKPALISNNEVITDVYIKEENVVIATVKNSKLPDKVHQYIVNSSDIDSVISYDLVRSNKTLIGFCFTSRMSVISVWNNGDICHSVLSSGLSGAVGSSLHFRVLANCSSKVLCSKHIRVLQVTARHFAILGKDDSKDGGRISLWDMDLFIEVSSRTFKVFSPPLKVYSLMSESDPFGGGVLLVEGIHVTAVPVIKMPLEGVLQLLQDDMKFESSVESVITRDWGLKNSHLNGSKQNLPNSFRKSHRKNETKKRKPGTDPSFEVLDCLISEHNLAAVDEVECIKTLTEIAINDKNYQLVTDIIRRYKQIPEESKIKLLTLVLSSGDYDFKMLQPNHLENNGLKSNLLNGYQEDTPTKRKNMKHLKKNNKNNKRASISGDYINTNGDAVESMDVDKEQNKIVYEGGMILSSGKASAINYILAKPIIESSLLKELEKLNFRDAIELINHTCDLLCARPLDTHYTDEFITSGNVHTAPSSVQALTWLTVLKDAHYSGLKLEQQLNKESICSESKLELSEELIEYFTNLFSFTKLVKSLVEMDSEEVFINNNLSAHIGDTCYFSEQNSLL